MVFLAGPLSHSHYPTPQLNSLLVFPSARRRGVGVEAGDQGRGARLQRAADIGSRQVLLDVQRRADHAGILTILERMGRRGEVDVADVLGLVARQAVARGL